MDPETQDKLQTKMGAKYPLVTLIQKRMRELVSGQPPLVDGDPTDLWGVATREILEDRISLVTGDEAERLRKEALAREAEAAPALAGKTPVPAAVAEEKKA